MLHHGRREQHQCPSDAASTQCEELKRWVAWLRRGAIVVIAGVPGTASAGHGCGSSEVKGGPAGLGVTLSVHGTTRSAAFRPVKARLRPGRRGPATSMCTLVLFINTRCHIDVDPLRPLAEVPPAIFGWSCSSAVAGGPIGL